MTFEKNLILSAMATDPRIQDLVSRYLAGEDLPRESVVNLIVEYMDKDLDFEKVLGPVWGPVVEATDAAVLRLVVTEMLDYVDDNEQAWANAVSAWFQRVGLEFKVWLDGRPGRKARRKARRLARRS